MVSVRGDGVSCHHQHVRCWFARRQSGALSDAELVLLINTNETQMTKDTAS